jgi:HlyD family secretion protein
MNRMPPVLVKPIAIHLHPEIPMRLLRRPLVAIPTILVVGVVALWFAGVGRAAEGPDPASLVTVEKGTMVVSVVATGKVEPITKVEIKSKANGIIERLLTDVDQVVEPGQVLAELDRENLTARLREARANLQAAEAARDGAFAQVKKNEIEAESPEVELAQRNFRRAQQLAEQRLLSTSQLDESRASLEQAQNRQRAATGQLAIARARVVEAEANVAQARAAVERAVEELASATIRAPIRATVLTRDVEVGSPVSSILNMGANATLVMTLGDIDRVYVKGRVDEADIGRVVVGQPARITTEAFRDRVFDGKVTRISPIGVDRDNVTTFAVEVSIDNPEKILKANMTANAEIELDSLPDSLLVPESAVIYDAQRNAFVDLFDRTRDNGRRRVPVRVGVGNGSRTQILDGVREGDQVVLPG